jgi:glycosyltransferase involved in cell wall biosynthesis
LKILLAHSFYRIPGGEDRYVRRQAELLSRDHDVRLIEGRNDQLSDSVGTGIRMAYSRTNRRHARRVMSKFHPDLVHLHNAYPALGPSVHLAAEEASVPLVMTVHNYRMRCPNGLMFTEGSICRRCEQGNYGRAVLHQCFPSKRQNVAYSGALWLHRFVGRLQDKVSLFVCPSEFVREELLRWGIPHNRVVRIPHFVPAYSDADATPGAFGVYVGRLSSEKGVEVLLDALRLAKDPPFRVVGDGPLATALRHRAGRLGLKRTEFLGTLPPDRTGEVMRRSRFLVMPSVLNETAGLSGLEAMACGRPLLVTSLGGLPELVKDGCGLVCRSGDAADLAKGVERLMMDDRFCREAGERGLEKSRDEFGPETHLARLEAAYETSIDPGFN